MNQPKPSWRGLAAMFDKSAGRKNSTVISFQWDHAELELDETLSREVGQACDRWLAERRRLTALKISQKKTVDTPHTSAYNSPQL
jgi:hypothetical protein